MLLFSIKGKDMYKLLIGIMFSTGCVPFVESLEREDFETGTEEIQNIDNKVEYNDSTGGMSFFPGCDFYKDHPPVIDPDWSEASQESIRRGVKLWEKALGIELGDVPVSTEDCSRNNPVVSCIVKLDEHNIEGEESGQQIFLYVRTLRELKFTPDFLADLAAHEVGHYLMIGHTETGVMATHRHLVKDPEITQVDIDAYSAACKEG
jgi:hypothetical protein